jgi:hypothetical protein
LGNTLVKSVLVGLEVWIVDAVLVDIMRLWWALGKARFGDCHRTQGVPDECDVNSLFAGLRAGAAPFPCRLTNQERVERCTCVPAICGLSVRPNVIQSLKI